MRNLLKMEEGSENEYMPRTDVSYAPTPPFMRAFPNEVEEQAAKFKAPSWHDKMQEHSETEQMKEAIAAIRETRRLEVLARENEAKAKQKASETEAPKIIHTTGRGCPCCFDPISMLFGFGNKVKEAEKLKEFERNPLLNEEQCFVDDKLMAIFVVAALFLLGVAAGWTLANNVAQIQ